MSDIRESLYEQVEKILNSCTVDDVLFEREIVSLSVDSRVQDALTTLTENHIISAPVYDPTESKFVGFVDYNDLIELIVECYKTRKAQGTHVFKDVDSYLTSMALDAEHPFKSVLNLSRRNPYVAVPCGTKLLDVARLLSQTDSIVHRIAVEKDGKIVKIISQSHIVDILAANIKVFAHVLEGNLAGAAFVKPVAAVAATTPILDALEKICQNRVSGVAVVDPDNSTLIGNLSGSDIRALLATEEIHFDFFKLTAVQVVQVSRQMLPKHPKPDDAKSFAAVITVHPDTPVVDAIIKLAATKLHRLYITDAAGLPVGVLTLGDILRHWVRTPKTVAIPAQQ